jgi:hypothetical protein
VLARLDQLDGVESSYVDETGATIRVSLRQGADASAVSREVEQTLAGQARGGAPVRLGGDAAAEALRGAKWWDKGRVAADAAAQTPASSGLRARTVLAALLLACVAVCLGLLWRRRRRPAGEE